MAARTLLVPARDAKAEPVCLLTREWAQERAERPDLFLELATSQSSTDDGTEYRFDGGPETWQRVAVFIEEEGECCPFLSFEAREEDGEIVLRVHWPEEVWK